MAQTNLDRLRNNLRDYLRGYAHADPAALGAIVSCGCIAELAHEELRRRAARFILALPDDELRAIASGSISLVDLADEI